MSRDEERELVLDAVGEAWNEFVFYSRKLDKDLPARKLEQLVRDGIVTEAEIVSRWQDLVQGWNLS
jgi:hypothetical protein